MPEHRGKTLILRHGPSNANLDGFKDGVMITMLREATLENGHERNTLHILVSNVESRTR